MAKKPTRILGRDPVSQLYRAVIRYVESHGGNIVVIEGVQLQEWGGPYRFSIAVKCAGKRPMLRELDSIKPAKKENR